MFHIESESVNTGYYKLLDALIEHGEEVSPRSMPTYELRPFSWTITNPRKRSLEVVGRWKNLGFQLSEMLWILSGKDELEQLMHYVPYYHQFSDDRVVLRGAYGPRLRAWEAADGRLIDQFQSVYEKLSTSPDSRQGVMIIFDPSKDFVQSRDIPCTNWFHFVIRNSKLDMMCVMRSNDALWGTPYNMFNFMSFQEILAGWLNVEIGKYTHVVSCMHVYKDKLDMLRRIDWAKVNKLDVYDYLPPIDARLPKFDFERELVKINRVELASRGLTATDRAHALSTIPTINSGYWRDYSWALFIDNEIRCKKLHEAIKFIDEIRGAFKVSLLQKICRIFYRWKLEPLDYAMPHMRGYPQELQNWILENPIKELEGIGLEVE